MLSKNKIKLISSLKLKKFRDANSLFIAEGNKIVSELLNSSLTIRTIAATPDWLQSNRPEGIDEIIECSFKDLKKISSLTTPQDVIAVAEIPKYEIKPESFKQNLALALDDIQDPGNLGTIIRMADWFGIEDIYCSMNTADIYNPKVIQSTMGSFLRVKVHYVNLAEFLNESETTVYGTFMDGENIYSQDLKTTGIIVMGNEGKGISPEIESLCDSRISIPPADETSKAESLNVGVATGIILSEFFRKSMK